MSPSAHSPRHLTASTASRRIASPPSGSTAPGVGHPEFEDFMNAYRPTLEVTNPKGERIQPAKDDSKADFGRSLKRLMKRGQPSPGATTKSIHRTPLENRERSVVNELRPPTMPMQAKKAMRPSSVIMECGVQLSPSLHKSPAFAAAKPEPLILKNSAKVKTDKGSSSSSLEVGQRSPVEIISMSLPLTKISEPSPSTTRRKISAQEQQQQLQQQQQQQLQLQQQQHSEKELIRNIQPAKPVTPPSCPAPGDSYCLLFTRNILGRFLPPRRNPDVLLNMKAIEVPERMYQVIMEFDEGPQPEVPKSSQCGLQLQPERPEVWEERASWEQASAFSSIRGSGLACFGMLLINVERWTEFPFVTYLVVTGGTTELLNKVNHLRTSRPLSHIPHHMHFTTGFDELVTLCQPPFPPMPEHPVSDRTGFVVSLYQVLPGEDGLRFEQNWGTWTGARHLFYHAPDYLGLRRMSIHKSCLPSSIILYAMICEFSEIMDHVTEACVLVDQIRARCCGFIGIFRILDSL